MKTIESNWLMTEEREKCYHRNGIENQQHRWKLHANHFCKICIKWHTGKALQLWDASMTCASTGSVIQLRADHLICSWCAYWWFHHPESKESNERNGYSGLNSSQGERTGRWDGYKKETQRKMSYHWNAVITGGRAEVLDYTWK